jgi:OPA family glycerol-3-phosphate transporter-like MFS transporter
MTSDPAALLELQAPTDMAANACSLRRQQAMTLVILVVGYSGFYLCRSNLSVVTPMIVKEFGTHGVPEADAIRKIGWIISCATLVYGFGKFIGGMLGDLGGGRRNFLTGMGGAVLFTLLFTLGGAGTVPIFTLAFMGNRLVQSFGWPGMMKIAGRSFHYSSFGLIAGILSLSYLFGDAVSRFFMGYLIGLGVGWRGVFLIDAAVLAAWFVVTLLFLREKPAALGDREFPPSPGSLYRSDQSQAELPTETVGTVTDDGNGGPALLEYAGPATPPKRRIPRLAAVLVPLLTSPTFLVVCGLSLATTLIRETFNDWTPQYNVSVLHLGDSVAAKSSAIFSALGGVSVILSGWIADRLGRTGRAVVIVVGLALGGFAMYSVGAASPDHPGWAVARVGLIGFLLIGPYSYLAGSVSLDFGGSRGAATACGIIDGVGYLASSLAGSGFAAGLRHFGWTGAFHRLAIIAWSAAGLGLVYWFTQRKPSAVGTEAAAT